MDLLTDEAQELLNKKNAKRNLVISLVSLGILILSALVYMLVLDSFSVDSNRTTIQILILLFYGLMILAGILALISFKRSLSAMQKSNEKGNHIALVISILVVMAVANEILKRF
jgi:Kef-type K+ transport system membrane component KefB